VPRPTTRAVPLNLPGPSFSQSKGMPPPPARERPARRTGRWVLFTSLVIVAACTSETGPQVTVTPGLVFASVSARGYSHTCGVTTKGAAYCWGTNYVGQLGNGTTASSATPVAVAGGLTFAAVSAGSNHTCGVTTNGAAYCWGTDVYGRLGIDSTAFNILCPTGACEQPVPVAGGLSFASVSAGEYHTCGVTTGGTGYCWGFGFDGELGNGPPPWSNCNTTTAGPTCLRPVPVAGGLTFAAVNAGSGVTCGVTTVAAAYCWGSGPIGTDTTTWARNCTDGTGFTYFCSFSPVAVAGGLSFQSVSAGGNFACGVTPTGAAHCWGGSAELAQAGFPYSATPMAVGGGLTFAAVNAGLIHACGVTPAGAAHCWGWGLDGQLGNGSTTSSGTPVAVVGGLTFATVSAGFGHTCGVTTRGVAYCWGRGYEGMLGDGTTSSSSVPVKVASQP
jgi:alpha-tubulin suppressor-like RCC1 family protein